MHNLFKSLYNLTVIIAKYIYNLLKSLFGVRITKHLYNLLKTILGVKIGNVIMNYFSYILIITITKYTIKLIKGLLYLIAIILIEIVNIYTFMFNSINKFLNRIKKVEIYYQLWVGIYKNKFPINMQFLREWWGTGVKNDKDLLNQYDTNNIFKLKNLLFYGCSLETAVFILLKDLSFLVLSGIIIINRTKNNIIELTVNHAKGLELINKDPATKFKIESLVYLANALDKYGYTITHNLSNCPKTVVYDTTTKIERNKKHVYQVGILGIKKIKHN